MRKIIIDFLSFQKICYDTSTVNTSLLPRQFRVPQIIKNKSTKIFEQRLCR